MKRVLDVREQQLLVLLFVMQPEHDAFEAIRSTVRQQAIHRLVDMRSVSRDGRNTRPAQQAAL